MGDDLLSADGAVDVLQNEGRAFIHRSRLEGAMAALCAPGNDPEQDGRQQWRLHQSCRMRHVDQYVLPSSGGKRRKLMDRFANSEKTSSQVMMRFELITTGVARALSSEVNRASLLSTEHSIVRIYDEVTEIGTDHVMVMSEYCAAGPVLGWQETSAATAYGEVTVREIMRALLKALRAMHARFIVCGHVFPGKLLVDGNNNVKLNPFGLCKYLPLSSQLDLLPDAGRFLAPEIINDMGQYRPEADLYSAGAILYLLLFGRYAMPSATSTSIPIPAQDGLPADALDLLARLLHPSPSERGTAATALSHPWMQECTPTPSPIVAAHWARVHPALLHIQNARRLEDRIVRRFTTQLGDAVVAGRFARLLGDGCLGPGMFARTHLSADIYLEGVVGDVLRQGIAHISSMFLNQETAPEDPLGLLAAFLKEHNTTSHQITQQPEPQDTMTQ